jgi:hypothetical protein
MAWTTPRTWTDGELVTKAIMDPHIRDNFNVIGARFHLRKTADESATSDITLSDDTHLTFAIAANEVWVTRIGLWVNTGAGGLQMQMTGPAGATGIQLGFSAIGGVPTTFAVALGSLAWAATATYTNQFWTLESTVVNGATPGTYRLQWAQNASNGTASTLKANSFLIAERLA